MPHINWTSVFVSCLPICRLAGRLISAHLFRYIPLEGPEGRAMSVVVRHGSYGQQTTMVRQSHPDDADREADVTTVLTRARVA